MSRFKAREVNYNHNHSDSTSNCSIYQATLDQRHYRNKDPINNWGDYRDITSGPSDEEIAHSAQYWTDCFIQMCPGHEDGRIMNEVYVCELKSSPPLDNLRQEAMQEAMDPEFDEERILSPQPRQGLSKIKKRLHEALGCTTTHVPCESLECSVHLARRP